MRFSKKMFIILSKKIYLKDGSFFSILVQTRDYDLREHIPVPYDNLFQSILSFASRCQSYF